MNELSDFPFFKVENSQNDIASFLMSKYNKKLTLMVHAINKEDILHFGNNTINLNQFYHFFLSINTLTHKTIFKIYDKKGQIIENAEIQHQIETGSNYYLNDSNLRFSFFGGSSMKILIKSLKFYPFPLNNNDIVQICFINPCLSGFPYKECSSCKQGLYLNTINKEKHGSCEKKCLNVKSYESKIPFINLKRFYFQILPEYPPVYFSRYDKKEFLTFSNHQFIDKNAFPLNKM